MPEQPTDPGKSPTPQPAPAEVTHEDDGDYTITFTMYDPKSR
jgi:hypothetical protein